MPVGILVIFLSAILGLILLNKIKPKYFTLICFLLVLSSFNELMALYYFSVKQKILAYNIFSIIEIIIWGVIVLYSNVYKKGTYQIIIISFLVIGSLAEIFLKRGFHTISYRFFSVYLIIAAIVYFKSLLRLKKEHYLIVDGKFWLFMGLLIFHVVFFFYLTALDFKDFQRAADVMIVFRQILNITNILYYVSLSIGFVCFSYSRQ